MVNLYLDSEVLWTLAMFAATISITMFVGWCWDYLKTETMLREARYRFRQEFYHGR